MAPFIKTGGLNHSFCQKHNQKYPAGGQCPECARASAQLRFSEVAKESADFCRCDKHDRTYPRGDTCPVCAKEHPSGKANTDG